MNFKVGDRVSFQYENEDGEYVDYEGTIVGTKGYLYFSYQEEQEVPLKEEETLIGDIIPPMTHERFKTTGQHYHTLLEDSDLTLVYRAPILEDDLFTI